MDFLEKHAPKVADPFAGGGSIPLEARRLGFTTRAQDLNPIPVLLNRALVDIPARFNGQPPVGPKARIDEGKWQAARGLAADVDYYAGLVRDRLVERVSSHYPDVSVPASMGGGTARPIAWIWARIMACSNPACDTDVPLVSSFELSKHKDRPAYVFPNVTDDGSLSFEVRNDSREPPEPTKQGRGAAFRCLKCGHVNDSRAVKEAGVGGKLGARLMAVVAEGARKRLYLSPSKEQEDAADVGRIHGVPDGELPYDPRSIWCPSYGLTRFEDLFTARQKLALVTLMDLVSSIRAEVREAAAMRIASADHRSLAGGGEGPDAYAEAVVMYLAFAVSKLLDNCSSLCGWHSGASHQKIRSVYGRQSLPMVWDFAEGNVISDSTGNFFRQAELIVKVLENLPIGPRGEAVQSDATNAWPNEDYVFSTDPPYYDNIPYADLSDFFYVWLRAMLRETYPDLLRTLVTPKGPELIATPYRHDGSKDAGMKFFEDGLGRAFERMATAANPAYPITIYYAFKQSESAFGAEGEKQTASTGWETMLEGIIRAGLTINATWPVRSELANRMIASGTNALASSIVLVCRPLAAEAEQVTRREFISALKRELPEALETLQQGNIAPVDLPQSTVGPGMAIFSRYKAVLEADGKPMRVRQALQLINQVLDEFLTKTEGELDTDTRAAITWFEQYEYRADKAGFLDQIARARNTSTSGLQQAGIFAIEGDKARLLPRDELRADWDPIEDPRLTVWECTQHLIKALEEGEAKAGALLAKIKARISEDAPRALAYRLYTACERRGWAKEARAYNELVASWPHIQEGAVKHTGDQGPLYQFAETNE
jgi:putative DNA methylase